MDLQRSNDLCRLLSDGTRLRLLALLSAHELTVSELTELLGAAQSRVSTHLGKLKAEGLVTVRRNGVGSLYSVPSETPGEAAILWRRLAEDLDDPLLRSDVERAGALIAKRARPSSWVDSVAGAMERHYSPGRTWPSAARALIGLLQLGDVLDIASGDGALASLMSARARSMTCVDKSDRVLEAGRSREVGVRFVQGDMHALPFEDMSFDQVLLLHALTYAESPQRAVLEAGRVLRTGGSFVAQTLARHSFADDVRPFDHVHLGFEVENLRNMVEAAGLHASLCEITHEERRKPFFKIVTIFATKDGPRSAPKENQTNGS